MSGGSALDSTKRSSIVLAVGVAAFLAACGATRFPAAYPGEQRTQDTVAFVQAHRPRDHGSKRTTSVTAYPSVETLGRIATQDPDDEPVTRLIAVDGHPVPGDGHRAVEVPLGRHEVVFEIELANRSPRYAATLEFTAGTLYETRAVARRGDYYGLLEEIGPFGYASDGYIYVYAKKRPQLFKTTKARPVEP
jgi:hypothetical protein